MIKLPIVPDGPHSTVAMPEGALPSFYMEDYSVLGLRVGNYDDALRVLKETGIRVDKGECSSRLFVEDSGRIADVVVLLNAAGNPTVLTDIADQIYQG